MDVPDLQQAHHDEILSDLRRIASLTA